MTIALKENVDKAAAGGGMISDLLHQGHQGDVGESGHQMQKRSWTSSSQKRGVCWDLPVRRFQELSASLPLCVQP